VELSLKSNQKEKPKSQNVTTLNGIKTVSLNELNKSGGQSSARQMLQTGISGTLSSSSGQNLTLKNDKASLS